MKRNLILIMAIVLFAGLVAGCGDSKREAAIDEMDTTNAPTLGPVAKEFMKAVVSKDGAKAWDMLSKGSKAKFEADFEKIDKTQLQKQLDDLKKAEDKGIGADVPIPQDKLDMMKKAQENAIKMLEAQLEAKDAKDYFIIIMSTMMDMSEESEDAEKDEVGSEFVSEKIDGDKGYIVMKDKKDKIEHKMHFVKEEGDWKVDIAPVK